jgi:hypothetical protein
VGLTAGGGFNHRHLRSNAYAEGEGFEPSMGVTP